VLQPEQILGGKKLDLYMIYNSVIAAGGYEQVRDSLSLYRITLLMLAFSSSRFPILARKCGLPLPAPSKGSKLNLSSSSSGGNK
jgi:hypothetical protein